MSLNQVCLESTEVDVLWQRSSDTVVTMLQPCSLTYPKMPGVSCVGLDMGVKGMLFSLVLFFTFTGLNYYS